MAVWTGDGFLPEGTHQMMHVSPLPFCPLWVVYLPSSFIETVNFSFKFYISTSYLAANVFPREILVVLYLNHISPCPFPDHTLAFSKGSVGMSSSLWYSSLYRKGVTSAHAHDSAQKCCSGCICAIVIVTCMVYHIALMLYIGILALLTW